MLESHQLFKAQNSKVGIAVCARGVWSTSIAILDTGAGPIFIKKQFVIAACASFTKAVKASRLRSTSSISVRVKRLIIHNLQMRQLLTKIEFLVVPILATKIILRTAFTHNSVKKINPKSMLDTLVESSPVAI